MEGVSKLPALDPEDLADHPAGIARATPYYARHIAVIQPRFSLRIEPILDEVGHNPIEVRAEDRLLAVGFLQFMLTDNR